MLGNYFKIAWRSLLKNRAFSIINILGLSIGLTACFLIFLFVSFERSYDAFHTKGNRIYRVTTDLISPSETLRWKETSAPMAIAMQKDFPGIESVVRMSEQSFLVNKGDIKFQEKNTLMADSTLFTVFDFPLLYGDKKTVLKEPMSIVLSQTAAKKYFGDKNPIGQTVQLTGRAINARITGVMKDLPENSQIKADMIVSLSSQRMIYNNNWDSAWSNFSVVSYVLLKPGSQPDALSAKLPAFIKIHIGDELKKDQTNYRLSFQPLRDVYLHSNRDNDNLGNVQDVYIFSVIAVFILLIACINFVNLTTARSAERAKEVGIRKVAGAGRFQLMRQFLIESLVICLFAFLLTLFLSFLLIPLFNQLAGKTISTGLFQYPSYIFLLLGIAVCIGLIAGIYPAFVLSSYRPSTVLKGRFVSGTKGVWLRKGLVVTQFTISIALIIATIVVYSQLNYMRSQRLGFDKEQTLIIDTNGDKNEYNFKQSLSSVPGILGTSFSNSVPGGMYQNADSKIENQEGEMLVSSPSISFIDFDYLHQYKIPIIAGRSFTKGFATDSTQAMIINESMVRLLGYHSPQAAIGKRFEQWGRSGKIIGVVKDFHYQSLQQPITPLTLRIEPQAFHLLSVKVSASNLPTTLKTIEENWSRTIPNRPFEYSFLDEDFDKLYRAEDRFGNLFFNFAVLAIFISCLGLLGLASYSTLQRTKEVGVRKVLGASIANIINLLSVDFIKLVIIAFLIAMPLAWWGMNEWLKDFAYRTEVTWWMFAATAIASLLIAFTTISFQAIKAAIANPVKSLRTE